MNQDIGLFEAIDTQRALRHMKPDPVPDALLRRVLESAIKAPSGANRQPWEFVVIRDPALKRQIARWYKRAWDDVYGTGGPSSGSLAGPVQRSAAHLAEHMDEAPILILACVRTDGSPGSTGRGASIYPAVQNMLLAARGLGLASALTTLHKRYESEVKAILGIPEEVETAALLPLGFPSENVRYGPPRRRPLSEALHFDGWAQTGMPEAFR